MATDSYYILYMFNGNKHDDGNSNDNYEDVFVFGMCGRMLCVLHVNGLDGCAVLELSFLNEYNDFT